MPLRFPKMYSFIFGFHRLVWCPKWTPASRSSFIETEIKQPLLSRGLGLALRELEAGPGAALSVLLPLLGAGIPRQESRLFEPRAQLPVVLDEGAGQPVADGARLAGHAAPFDADVHVELVRRLGEQQRLPDD